MNRPEAEETIDLREYLTVLKARRWTVLVVAVLVVGATLAFSFLQTPVYTAKARVLVKPTNLPAGTTTTTSDVAAINVETETEVATSQPVAELVIQDLGLDQSVKSLLSGLSVKGITETEVLDFSYTSESPEFARDAANSFAENYTTYRRQQTLQTVLASQDAIQARIDAASTQLTEVNQDIEAAREANDTALMSTLETSRNVLIARLGVLQQRLDDLQANQSADISVGQLLEEAGVPSSPSSPNYLNNALLGAFIGLALGVGAAFLKERLDDRFRGRVDVERVLEGPVLATIPRFRSGKQDDHGSLVTASQPSGFASESYRTLRTNLQFIAEREGIKSVLVTSPTAGEGKTVTTANLAIVLAQAGSRVIVVSSDLRRPTLDALFFSKAALDGRGLSAWFTSADREPIWNFIRDPGIPNIRVLPIGQVPPNPAELLTSPRLAELVQALESQADIVLFDSAPVLAVADSTLLASKVGGTVLVVNALSTHRSPTKLAKEELERVGGRLIGAVLNSFDPSVSPYYYGPHYYAYESSSPATPVNGGKQGPARGRFRRLTRSSRR